MTRLHGLKRLTFAPNVTHKLPTNFPHLSHAPACGADCIGNAMKTSPAGIAAIVLHEGIVPGPYRDSVGVWTYGIGHTAAAGSPNPENLARGMPPDLDAALSDVFALFARDLAEYEADVNCAVKVKISQSEFDALVSFHYNTGSIFRAALTDHLNAGFRLKAADAFMGWSKPKEIIPRRKAEQALFAHGTYPTGKATVWGVTPTGAVIWKAQRALGMAEIVALMSPPAVEIPPALPSWLARLIAWFKGA